MFNIFELGYFDIISRIMDSLRKKKYEAFCYLQPINLSVQSALQYCCVKIIKNIVWSVCFGLNLASTRSVDRERFHWIDRSQISLNETPKIIILHLFCSWCWTTLSRMMTCWTFWGRTSTILWRTEREGWYWRCTLSSSPATLTSKLLFTLHSTRMLSNKLAKVVSLAFPVSTAGDISINVNM